MDHPSPASFPDPVQRVGTPVTPPPGTEPNPAYQDLLTLYARVYGAGDKLEKALRPAGRTVSGGEAWTGPAARRWTTELDAWNRRLGNAAAQILTELTERLRATPPYVAVGTRPIAPGGPYPGAPSVPGPDPGGRMYPGHDPEGVRRPGSPDPGGVRRPGPADPGGAIHRTLQPGGPFRVSPQPGPRLHHEPGAPDTHPGPAQA
jgi:hypothetical protein